MQRNAPLTDTRLDCQYIVDLHVGETRRALARRTSISIARYIAIAQLHAWLRRPRCVRVGSIERPEQSTLISLVVTLGNERLGSHMHRQGCCLGVSATAVTDLHHVKTRGATKSGLDHEKGTSQCSYFSSRQVSVPSVQARLNFLSISVSILRKRAHPSAATSPPDRSALCQRSLDWTFFLCSSSTRRKRSSLFTIPKRAARHCHQ